MVNYLLYEDLSLLMILHHFFHTPCFCNIHRDIKFNVTFVLQLGVSQRLPDKALSLSSVFTLRNWPFVIPLISD